MGALLATDDVLGVATKRRLGPRTGFAVAVVWLACAPERATGPTNTDAVPPAADASTAEPEDSSPAATADANVLDAAAIDALAPDAAPADDDARVPAAEAS